MCLESHENGADPILQIFSARRCVFIKIFSLTDLFIHPLIRSKDLFIENVHLQGSITDVHLKLIRTTEQNNARGY